jgi:Neurotransmitter-gated ion-channel ligand binding domain/Neurotransmitter-gated ion-channel transmembrane region
MIDSRKLLALILATVPILARPSFGVAHAATRVVTDQELPPAFLLDPPMRGGKPVEIAVGLFFLNLISLDEAVQTFTFAGYLYAEWNDYRLAEPQDDVRYYRPGEIWQPCLEFDNAAAPPEVLGRSLTVDQDGTVHYTEMFTARLSADLNLRPFPFDTQTLDVVIHPVANSIETLVLKPSRAPSGISAQPYAPLPLWSLVGFSEGSVAHILVLGTKRVSALDFHVKVQRQTEFYVWKIFLPLLLMVVISWGVFIIPLNDLSNQLLITITTLLTLIAFSFSLSTVIPRMPKLTYYDVYFLLCYLFVLLSVGEVLLVYATYNRRTSQEAMHIRRISRCAMPLGFFLSNAIAGLLFHVI